MAVTESLPKVRASELVGRGWLNTGGKDLTLADLRGKIVVLDFWTLGWPRSTSRPEVARVDRRGDDRRRRE